MKDKISVVSPQGIIKKIETRTARAGVIGLGYVGLPLAVAIARGMGTGFRVTGIDICSKKNRTVETGHLRRP